MSEKRKDHKGRILRTGEGQRKDGLYQYRYNDCYGVRRTVYSPTLSGLREKEEEIYELIKPKIDTSGKNKTVSEICFSSINRKRAVIRYSTYYNRSKFCNIISRHPFSSKKIGDVRMSDAKSFLISLHENGMMFGSIRNVHDILRTAFQEACDDNQIIKNPFDFHLSKIIKNDAKKKISLSPEQVMNLLEFVKGDAICKKYYDDFIILLGTGLRVSEFCGITMNDLDFDNRVINIDHQLFSHCSIGKRVLPPKTASGIRKIPMSDVVYETLLRVIQNRATPEIEPVVDGYTGFVFLAKNHLPKHVDIIEREVRTARRRFNDACPDNPLPVITPHTFRHTFCTTLINNGMSITAVQYLMGHSNSRITLETYTHASYENAAVEMERMNALLTSALPTGR